MCSPYIFYGDVGLQQINIMLFPNSHHVGIFSYLNNSDICHIIHNSKTKVLGTSLNVLSRYIPNKWSLSEPTRFT